MTIFVFTSPQTTDQTGYFYYFCATSMALLCLVHAEARWYCADRVWCIPPLRKRASRSGEVFYASDAPVLRGNWFCGGPLDF